MAFRKYGTSDDQRVTEVEATDPEGDEISKSAAKGWSAEDERDLQGETER